MIIMVNQTDDSYKPIGFRWLTLKGTAYVIWWHVVWVNTVYMTMTSQEYDNHHHHVNDDVMIMVMIMILVVVEWGQESRPSSRRSRSQRLLQALGVKNWYKCNISRIRMLYIMDTNKCNISWIQINVMYHWYIQMLCISDTYKCNIPLKIQM